MMVRYAMFAFLKCVYVRLWKMSVIRAPVLSIHSEVSPTSAHTKLVQNSSGYIWNMYS